MSTETTTTQVDFNHWLLRFIALVIDSILIGIIVGAIWWILLVTLLFSGTFWWLWAGWGWTLLFPFIFGIVLTLYSAVLEVSSKATLGKRLLGLEVRVVGGGTFTFDKALIRNISKIYWIFLLLDWVLCLVTPGRDPHQKYTDRVAGTTVVAVRQVFVSGTAAPAPPPPPPPPS
jgi:uncharacterized RDD family membrane protein YckC